MTVALLGVGADSSNSSPTPPVYEDYRFEYIPIPESEGSSGTTETRTFGNTSLKHQDQKMADYLDYILPTEEENDKISGESLRKWPFHYDPNFESLTYGECISRPAYVKVLRQLNPGDIVAFYTGLKHPDTRFKHRYIIGYFTIQELVDFENLKTIDGEKGFSELTESQQMELIGKHKENAHSKRFLATGSLKHGEGLIIVDGKEPGGLMNKAYPISRHNGGGHYYLKDDLLKQFSPKTGNGKGYLGGFKQAHLLDIEPNNFVEIIETK